MKKEHAQALYKMGGESKEIALQYFSENELFDTRPKSWDDLGGVTGWYVGTWSEIEEVDTPSKRDSHRNIFPTKEYAEAVLALAQLLQIKQWWFDGKIDYRKDASGIACDNLDGELHVYDYSATPYWTHFPSLEMADEFLNEPEIRKLLEQVKPLL